MLGQSFDESQPLDLAEACRGSLPALLAATPGHAVLETDLPSPGPLARMSPNQVQQVLADLIRNAWDAAGEGQGAVHLCVKTVRAARIPARRRFPGDWQPQHEAYACLEVTDAGGGIADEDIERLFDPFFSTKISARGRGLAVVLDIVKAHGGVVTVASTPGRGSTFQVLFPVAAETILRPTEHAVPTPETEGRGTILLVEDDELLRDMAAGMLAHLGYAVLAVTDGVEAVAVFRQRRGEIRGVLCDVTMPRLNGWETLAALRALDPALPVILASGYDEAQVMAGDHPHLPQVFLGKPYKLKDLRDAISQALPPTPPPR